MWEWDGPSYGLCDLILQSNGPVQTSLGTTPTPTAPDIILNRIVGRGSSGTSFLRTGLPPGIYQTAWPRNSGMAQFIDFGDSCSTSGPQSSIGDYEIDSFIDDNSVHDDTISRHVRNSRPRDTSPLFVASRSTSQSTKDSERSRESTPLIRRSRQLDRQRRRESPYSTTSSWVERQRQREYSILSSASVVSSIEHGRGTTNVAQHISAREQSGAEHSGRFSTPDPFQIPEHIDADKCPGLGVPSKRLGSKRPRFAGRYFLFTFPQSGHDWPYPNFVERIEALGGKHHICRERHGDGGYHFHCLVDFERKFDFENVHRFCVGTPKNGQSRSCPGQAHCNILPIRRTPYNTWDYVGKDGDIVSSNLERPPVRGGNVSRDDLWSGSLALSNKKEFLEDLKKHSARDYVLFHRQITRFAEGVYNPIVADTPKIEEDGVYVHWERYPKAKQWVLESFSEPIARIKALSRGNSYPANEEARDTLWLANRPDGRRRRPKSLIIWGPSRLGKTIFATNLGTHIHWHRDFNLKRLTAVGVENIEYVIFDDIPWTNKALRDEGYKAWFGGQERFDTTDKYCGKSTITWGKQSIFLSNNDPYTNLTADEIDWFEANCVVIALGPRDEERTNAICSSDAHVE